MADATPPRGLNRRLATIGGAGGLLSGLLGVGGGLVMVPLCGPLRGVRARAFYLATA